MVLLPFLAMGIMLNEVVKEEVVLLIVKPTLVEVVVVLLTELRVLVQAFPAVLVVEVHLKELLGKV